MDSSFHPHRICAVVVAYFPDDEFEVRLADVLPQVDIVLIIDNTPREKRLSSLGSLQQSGKVAIVQMGFNAGIGAALNAGLDYAYENGCDLMLSLDQDTKCRPGMADSLLALYEEMQGLAVVGSNYHDSRNGKFKVSPAGPEKGIPQKTVITSGCLVNVQAARSNGGFREDYFIDQVDHEFCLRMKAHGLQIAITRYPGMSHSVGESDGIRIPIIGALPQHGPLRKYYITRNSLITIATYWRQEPAWSSLRLVRLFMGALVTLLLDKERGIKTRAFILGFRDAIRHRMGPCQWQSLTS